MVGKRDIARGKVERGVGKVKEEVGDALDNRSLEMRGRGEQARGAVREGIGRGKRAIGGKD